MRSKEDFRPRVGRSSPDHQPNDWLTAKKALSKIRRTWRGYPGDELLKPAAEGYLHTWASSFQVGETTWSRVELPSAFWGEAGFSMRQDWVVGDFEVSIKGGLSLRARNVMFNVHDLARVFPKAFGPRPEARLVSILPGGRQPTSAQAAPHPDPALSRPAKGGRPMSEAWPNWVAEVAALIHDEGIPDGVGTSGLDDFIARIADRLAMRELEGPSRTTVQAAAKAVLLRLRAGN